MPDAPKPAPCIRCDQPVLPGVDVCLRCGGLAPYQSLKDGEYGVDCGPVASANFRRNAADVLVRLFQELPRDRIDHALAASRVRVCSNLEKPVAEAIAARLGRQETQAAVVTGAPFDRKGIVVGFALPWPYLAAIVGLALAVVFDFWLGLILAIGGSVGLALALGHERQHTLGEAPVPPQADAAYAPLARKAAALLGSLDEPTKKSFAAVTGSVADVLDAVRKDKLLGITAGGEQGALGRAAVQLLEDAVAAAEQGGKDALARYAEAAQKTRDEVAALGREAEKGGNIQVQVNEQSASLSRRVGELKKVR